MLENTSHLTPDDFFQRVELAWPLSTVKEQKRLLEHAKAWAIVWHDGNVPESINQKIQALEAQYAITR